MSIFNSKSTSSELGYIDKNTILEYVSQEDIFELVFGFKPIEFVFVSSPFRDDRSPGCWFESTIDGKLKFKDFASDIYIRGKQMVAIDCFDAIQVYFKLPNLYQTLLFIENKLLAKKNLVALAKPITIVQKVRNPVEIFIETRELLLEDKFFWQDRYEISKENLRTDLVFPTSSFLITGTKFGDYKAHTIDLCYAFTNFKDSKKKLYRPFETGSRRFNTNLSKNDIGGIDTIDYTNPTLLISKSYKDWRVLKNQGLNVIWFQNEGMIPDLDILIPILQHFRRVIVFFDNDNAGMIASKKLVTLINKYLPGISHSINLPLSLQEEGISDPSDLIYSDGRKELISFLAYKNVF